jgi:hypothetical protein
MNWIWPILAIAIVAMWTFALVDLIRKRHTRPGGKIAAWVLIIILLPVVGSIAYFVVNAGGGGEAAPRDPTVGPIP